MKIKVQHKNGQESVSVKRVGGLEGQIRSFVTGLQIAEGINRAALRGCLIIQIGGLTNGRLQ